MALFELAGNDLSEDVYDVAKDPDRISLGLGRLGDIRVVGRASGKATIAFANANGTDAVVNTAFGKFRTILAEYTSTYSGESARFEARFIVNEKLEEA